jgi:glutamine amidotransferase
MIAIIDYGTGNTRSIQSMLSYIGVSSHLTSSPTEIELAEKLILPGVGHFDYGMSQLRKSGLDKVLTSQVLEKKVPVLGICLGAQLLTRGSQEGSESGLGWLPADTVRFDHSRLTSELKIPHMGWAETEFVADSPLSKNLESPARFYYVHSYHLQPDTIEMSLCFATHGYRFAAGIGRDNIIGVQFHPEKSHKFGMQLLRNFVSMGEY